MSELCRIPEQVYVGFQGRRTEDEVPLGFMTPYTDDAAGKTRQATVDKWAKGYGRSKVFNSVIIDNEPMVGFRLGRAIRRAGHFGSGSTVVRIEDPRGFELEITVENLVAVLETVPMEQCEFVGELVWGRVGSGTKNVLIAVNSDLFKQSLRTKAKVAEAKTAKDFNIGDKIETVGGDTGIYMGMLYGIVDNYNFRNSLTTLDAMSAKKPVIKVVDSKGEAKYLGLVDLKATMVEQYTGPSLTTQDSENEIFAAMKTLSANCEYRGTVAPIIWTAAKSISTTRVSKDINFEELLLIIKASPNRTYCTARINGNDTTVYREDDILQIYNRATGQLESLSTNVRIVIKGWSVNTKHNSVDLY